MERKSSLKETQSALQSQLTQVLAAYEKLGIPQPVLINELTNHSTKEIMDFIRNAETNILPLQTQNGNGKIILPGTRNNVPYDTMVQSIKEKMKHIT